MLKMMKIQFLSGHPFYLKIVRQLNFVSLQIGVIVIIGPYKENGTEMIDPYMPLKEQDTVKYGTFSLKTVCAQTLQDYELRIVDLGGDRQAPRMVIYLNFLPVLFRIKVASMFF